MMQLRRGHVAAASCAILPTGVSMAERVAAERHEDIAVIAE